MGTNWHEGSTRSSEDTAHLRQRLEVNASGSNTVPFHEWAASLIREFVPADGAVADLGCGIGKLGEALSSGGFTGVYVGVDTSKTHEESFRRAAPAGAEFVPEGLASWCSSSRHRFDAVASVYSLYYEETFSPRELLERMLDRTTPRGRAVVIGPYGANNASWFELLERAGVAIPARVRHESSGYLEDVVRAAASLTCDVRLRHYRNDVVMNAEKARAYWRSVIYRDEARDEAVDATLSGGCTIVKEALYLDVRRA